MDRPAGLEKASGIQPTWQSSTWRTSLGQVLMRLWIQTMAIRGRGLWTQLGTADNHTSAQTLEVGLQCGRTACASHGVARTHSEYVPASFICQGSRARYWGVRWNFRIQGSVISSELSLQGSYMYVVREY